MRPSGTSRPLAVRLLTALSLALLVGCDSDDVERRPLEETPPQTLLLTYRVLPTEEYGAPQVDVLGYTGADGAVGRTTDLAVPRDINIQIPNGERAVYELEASRTSGPSTSGLIAQILVNGELKSRQVAPGAATGIRMTRTARAVYLHVPPDDL